MTPAIPGGVVEVEPMLPGAHQMLMIAGDWGSPHPGPCKGEFDLLTPNITVPIGGS
jgi:hypothetical protein